MRAGGEDVLGLGAGTFQRLANEKQQQKRLRSYDQEGKLRELDGSGAKYPGRLGDYKAPQMGQLIRNVFLSFGGWNTKIRVLTGLGSGDSFLPGCRQPASPCIPA